MALKKLFQTYCVLQFNSRRNVLDEKMPNKAMYYSCDLHLMGWLSVRSFVTPFLRHLRANKSGFNDCIFFISVESCYNTMR